MNAKLIRFLIVTLVLVNNTTAQHGNRKSGPSPSTQQNLPSITRQQWFTFNSPDKDFIVEFPTKPRRDADSEVPAGTMRNYILDTDSISFQLSYVDVGVEPTSREGNELPLSFRRSMLDQANERGWVVLRSELLRKNVYEQETWSPMKRNHNLRLHYVERNIVRYGRQYILSCSSLVPEQKVNPDLCYRFFNSFRVVREPQPQ